MSYMYGKHGKAAFFKCPLYVLYDPEGLISFSKLLKFCFGLDSKGPFDYLLLLRRDFFKRLFQSQHSSHIEASNKTHKRIVVVVLAQFL